MTPGEQSPFPALQAPIDGLKIRFGDQVRCFEMGLLRRCNTRRTYRVMRGTGWVESPSAARYITTLSICDAITGRAA